MKEKHGNPFTGIAKFLISLGIVMFVAKLDLLGLGDIPEYFSWQMLLIFFGVWLLLSFKFVSAVIFFAIGFWFLMPDMAIQLTESYKKIYWPVVLILCGVAFMLKPLAKSCR